MVFMIIDKKNQKKLVCKLFLHMCSDLQEGHKSAEEGRLPEASVLQWARHVLVDEVLGDDRQGGVGQEGRQRDTGIPQEIVAEGRLALGRAPDEVGVRRHVAGVAAAREDVLDLAGGGVGQPGHAVGEGVAALVVARVPDELDGVEGGSVGGGGLGEGVGALPATHVVQLARLAASDVHLCVLDQELRPQHAVAVLPLVLILRGAHRHLPRAGRHDAVHSIPFHLRDHNQQQDQKPSLYPARSTRCAGPPAAIMLWIRPWLSEYIWLVIYG